MIIKKNYANTIRETIAIAGLKNGKLIDLTPRVSTYRNATTKEKHAASLHVSIAMKKKELKERLEMFCTLKAEGDSQNKKSQVIIDPTIAKITANGKEGYIFVKEGQLTTRAEALVLRDLGE